MRLNLNQLKIVTILILLTILISQGIWVYNMSRAYRAQHSMALNASLEAAVLREISGRHEQLGGTISMSMFPKEQDTARYVTKTIRTEDTTFQVTSDRFDPHFDFKLMQFLLKDELPVNVIALDSIFRLELTSRKFPVAATYIEYIDLEADRVIGSSYADMPVKHSLLASDLVVIDIFKTLGVRAYVENTAYSILRMMTVQLFLSAVMIIICITFLFLIIRTFFWKEKVEIMRQDSVNAMTHEFKRPISSALAQASLIPYYLSKNDTDKVQQYADNILLDMNKLSAYTERIQKLGNNSKEHIFLTKTDIAIKPFFESVVRKYTDTDQSVDGKSVTIRLNLSTSRTHIQADLIHFSNMVENLIENALKYSGEELILNISISDEASMCRIAVRDNGFGIPKTEINRIFDRFYRGTTKEVLKNVGFGLGLTYVKALAEAHDGSIEVLSIYGEGSIFVLSLP